VQKSTKKYGSYSEKVARFVAHPIDY